MGLLEYKGYRGTVDYDEKDDCLFGKVLGMRKDLVLYQGQTLDELRKDFVDAIDDYIAGCEADGIAPRKPFSGKLVVRMPSDLHGRVADAAAEMGTTINDFINRAIVDELDRRYP